MNKQDYSSYILPIGFLIIGFMVLKRFGIIKDTAAETTEQQQLFRDYLSPNYLIVLAKKYGGKIKVWGLKQSEIEKIATDIYNSKGVFNDDESLLFTSIKKFKYKTQVSQVSKFFAEKYKQDLGFYLNSFLNETELKRIYDFLDSLPIGLQ